ncbi:MAG: sensor histidine kinase [Ardenticatenaceae bacterium]
MRSLRSRLIVSHILPLLLVIPLLGVVLIYVLETQVFLADVREDVTQQAEWIATLANQQPGLWQTPEKAQEFLEQVGMQTITIVIVDSSGGLLASNEDQNSTVLEPPAEEGLSEALTGRASQKTYQVQQTIIVISSIPVHGSDQQLKGAIQLKQQLDSRAEELQRLRYWIGGVVLAALLVGIGVGLWLALNLERPLRRVTGAVNQLADGQRLEEPLPERGPKEIRLLSHAFNTLNKQLRTLESARRHMLANLVHELGRPLGAVQAAVDALRSGADEDKAFRRELLTGIAGEVKRLGRLIESLAQLHGQILGTFELKRRPIAFGEWLPGVLSPWRVSAHEADLEWQSSVPEKLPTVNLDPDRFGQVLGNLLSNAIKYTPSGGTLTVSAGHNSNEVWVRVSDTGLGIPPEEQKRIFQPFYRSRTHKRFPQGMGLGLTITREIVAAHGGRLALESSSEGSEFTVYLPWDE